MLVIGLKNGEPIHVDQVLRGLKCDCVCPYCGEQLVAKQGNILSHHFAHVSEKECSYSVQTAIHYEAKKFLSMAKTIKLPPVYYSLDEKRTPIQIRPEQQIVFDNVELEKKQDNIIPDIVGYYNGKKIFIEI